MPSRAELPIIALAAMVSAEAIERGRARWLPRFRRQVRPGRADCGNQGTERRSQSGGMTMNDSTELSDYVTFSTAGQMFGLPIERVQDVFKPTRITRVPLAGAEIAGVLNLRGRIVTAIELRIRLGLGAREGGQVPMAIGIELRGESFGLLVDAVGEVLKLSDDEREANPDQSRSQSRAGFGRRLSPRRTASCHSRHRSGSRSRRRGGCGVRSIVCRHDRCAGEIKAGSPAKRGVRTL